MNVLALMIVLIAQTTQPADTTMDWLLEQGGPAAAPATQPSTQPASPFKEKTLAGERNGVVTLSDGKVLRGVISTTAGKPIRLWSDEKKQFIDLSIDSIASMQAVILWERDEAEWRFKESGHDEKIYTGKTYPARETQYRVTLTSGDTVTGGIVAPVYLRAEGKSQQFVLNKRSKGEVGKSLRDLVYVKTLELE